MADYLEKVGVEAAAIHGDKRQGQRERALADFKAGKVRALVATDIASRGIDVDAVSHVVNFELPMTPEAYVHRIGRTARAGAGGSAVSLCADDERLLLKAIQKTTRQTLPAVDRRSDKSLVAPPSQPRNSGGDVEQKLAQPKAREHRRERRPEGGGQPHRQRNGGGGKGPAQAQTPRWDPMAGERRPDGVADTRPIRQPAAAATPGRSFKPSQGRRP